MIRRLLSLGVKLETLQLVFSAGVVVGFLIMAVVFVEGQFLLAFARKGL